MPRPPARAISMASLKTRGSGASRSTPAMSKPVRPCSAGTSSSGARHLGRHGRVMGAQGDRDETHVDAGSRRRSRSATDHRGDAVIDARGPARCAATVPSGSRHRPCRRRPRPRPAQRRAFERLGVLQQGDRQIERSQQLGLVAAALGGPRGARAWPPHPPGRSSHVVARRASSSAVAGRSEPSRWRCSSALGMARSQAREWRIGGVCMGPC